MTNKYPRILTEDVKKFKFALKVDTVKKVAELCDEWQYPNLSECIQDILDNYCAMSENI
jgi:hypothetical protein